MRVSAAKVATPYQPSKNSAHSTSNVSLLSPGPSELDIESMQLRSLATKQAKAFDESTTTLTGRPRSRPILDVPVSNASLRKPKKKRPFAGRWRAFADRWGSVRRCCVQQVLHHIGLTSHELGAGSSSSPSSTRKRAWNPKKAAKIYKPCQRCCSCSERTGVQHSCKIPRQSWSPP